MAMAAQGLVRATHDLDFFVSPEPEYRMKRDTVRPQDRLDAKVIKEEFKLEED
jgi:hypothetical protein